MKKLLVLLALFAIPLAMRPRFDPHDLYSQIATCCETVPPNVQALLDQPFSYLGQGSQAYAFASADGQYVLKLFKARHRKKMTAARFIEQLKKDRERSAQKWVEKFIATTSRYEEAYAHLKEETGLIYLHFQKTETPLPVTLTDRYKCQVDLSTLPFLIQRRAVLTPDYFKELLKQGGDVEKAKEALKVFFTNRLEKGYSDPRQSLSINYGFIDGVPMQIDVGKIERFTGDRNAELQKIHAHIDEWASQLSP